MQKNVTSQKVMVFAFDSTTNLPKTGDAANITAYVSKDYGAITVLGDTTATEMDATNAKGYYLFDLTQAETNADTLLFSAKSSTANIVVVGAPATVFTTPLNFAAASMPNAAAGASGGLLISGSNAGTTTLGALTVTGATTLTGAVSAAAGIAITQSSGNTAGLSITGNGSAPGTQIIGGSTGHGLDVLGGATSGNGAQFRASTSGVGLQATGFGTTKAGISATGGSTSSAGILSSGGGTGAGVQMTPGLTGIGLQITGGGTSGDGISVVTTSGHGVNLAPAGSSKHGLFVTGGNGGTSDGISAVAGTGGVPIRGNITGNITGNLSGSIGSVGAGGIAQASFAADVPSLATRTGTAQAGGASTITFDTGASAVDNFYRYQAVVLTGGTGSGQTNVVASYVGATKVATMDHAWATNPDNTTTFFTYGAESLPSASALTGAQIATAIFQDTIAGDFTVANSVGKSIMNGVSLGTGLTVAAVSGAVGSVTGAVGSVTGAVGSVTGNVGGNVVGSVGSVTGNVGGNIVGTLSAAERLAIADATLSRTLAAEAYAADGAVPTLSQCLYLISQNLGDFTIVGTTLTVHKLDGVSTAAVYTLDSATLPTSRTRTT